MNPLAAAALAAGELICEFNDGYRKSLLAELTGDAPRVEMILVYEAVKADSAEVLSSRWPGRHPVQVRATEHNVHFVQREGQSFRVTTLTACAREKVRAGEELCTRFSATYAWHFDPAAQSAPDAAYERLPSGSAHGFCEPWHVD